MMMLLQNMFLITVPFSTLLTTTAMLLPYWWASDTLQVGLWRARSLSSTWLLVEPQLETSEGRVLFVLQSLSFISVVLADISGLIWLFILLRRHSSTLLKLLFSLLTSTILTYVSLSIMIYLVWRTTQDYIHLINISYSFYIVLIIILLHSLTLISLTINLLNFQTNHHSIKPLTFDQKIIVAFNQDIV